MFLAYEFLEFFLGGYSDGSVIRPRSIMTWVENNAEKSRDIFGNRRIYKKLEQEGLLDHMGNSGNNPYYKEHYYTNQGVYQRDIGKYGGYDLLVKGLRAVRERFMPLVLPISVQNNQGDYSIGTGFLYSPDTIVTARHCIEGLQRISILLADQTAVSVDSVFFLQVNRWISPLSGYLRFQDLTCRRSI